MVPIDGLTTAAVAFLGKSSRLAIKVALVVWVVAGGRVVGGRLADVVGAGAPVGSSSTRCSARR